MGRTAAAARQEKPNCPLESASATAAVMSAHLPHDDALHITKGAARENIRPEVGKIMKNVI